MVVLLGFLLAVGLLGLGRLIRGLPLIPPGLFRVNRNRPARLTAKDQRSLLFPAGGGLGVAVAARSLVLGVVAGATVVLWPMIAGGGKVERAALSKLEALAQWTE